MNKNDKKPAKKLGKKDMKKTKGGLNFTAEAGNTGVGDPVGKYARFGDVAGRFTPGV